MTKSDFWELVARRGMPRFRSLRRSVPISQIDDELMGTQLEEEWLRLKENIKPTDRILAFELIVRSYLGMRRGYVVMRNGKPIGGLVTESS